MGRRWCGVVLLLAACRGSLASFADEAALADSASAASGAPVIDEASDEERGGRTGAMGGAAPATADGDVGGERAATDDCGAQPVTLEEIHAGRVRSGVAVSVPRLVASSQKFLVSEAKSGSCLWGVMAADPTRTGAGSGLFVVSFGAQHADGQACASGSDGLPDDVAVGDELRIAGFLDEFVPAACDGVAAAPQLRVDVACPARRSRGGKAPLPAVIDLELAARLAAGKDAQLLRDWSGALVRLEDVSALRDSDDGDAVYPFGVLRLEQSPLEVHSRLYYFDLSEGGPRASGKAPRFGYPTRFASVTGVVFLDYCTWVVAPRDRCSDLTPASENCASQAKRP